MANVMQYISNIGKSVTYATVDQLKKTSPAIQEFAEQNAELGKVLYQSVRDYKGTQKKIKDYVQNSMVGEAASVYKSALFEDIRTGKFYNRERIDKMDARAAGGLLDDIGDPFDNLEADFGDGDSSLDDLSNDIDSWGNIDNDNLFLADKVDNTGSKITQGVAMATARSSEYQVKASRENTNILNKHSEMMFGKVNAGMAAINSNISSLIDFNNKAMMTHIDNSRSFYENTTKALDTTNELLKQLVDRQNKMYEEETKKSNSDRIDYDDIVGAEGTIDIKAYAKRIKQNIADQSGGIFDQLKAFGEDSNMLLSFVSSPLKFIPEFVAKAIIPKTVEGAMNSLNDTISGFFSNAMLKLNGARTEDDPVMEFIKNTFGVSRSLKGDPNVGNYKRGPIPWDGESKAALTQVIPRLLSKILAANTGTEEVGYDYASGKWKKLSAVKKEHEDRLKSASQSATKDVEEAMMDILKNGPLMDISYEREQSLIKDIKNVLDTSFKEQRLLPVNKKVDQINASDWGIEDYENIQYIVPILNSLSSSKKGRKALNGFGNNIYSGVGNYNNYIKSIEELPSSIERAIMDGLDNGEYVKKKEVRGEKKAVRKEDNINSPAVANNIFHVKDNKGNNLFYYMQRIDGYLHDAREVLENIDDNIYGKTNNQVSATSEEVAGNAREAVRDATQSIGNMSRNREQRTRSRYTTADNRTSSEKDDDAAAQWRKAYDEEQRQKKRRTDELKRKTKNAWTSYKKGDKWRDEFTGNEKVDESNRKWNEKHGYYPRNFRIANTYFKTGNEAVDDSNREQAFADSLEAYFKSDIELKEREEERKANQRRKNKINSLALGDAAGPSSPADTHNKLVNFISGLDNLSEAPAKFISNMIHKVDQRMFQVIYGNEKEDEVDKNSFMGALVDRIDKTFRTIGDFFKEKVVNPLSDFIKGELFDKLREMWEENGGTVKDFLKAMFGDKIQFVKDSFKSAFSPITNTVKGELKDGFELPDGFKNMEEYKQWWIENEKQKKEDYKADYTTEKITRADGLLHEGVNRQSMDYIDKFQAKNDPVSYNKRKQKRGLMDRHDIRNELLHGSVETENLITGDITRNDDSFQRVMQIRNQLRNEDSKGLNGQIRDYETMLSTGKNLGGVKLSDKQLENTRARFNWFNNRKSLNNIKIKDRKDIAIMRKQQESILRNMDKNDPAYGDQLALVENLRARHKELMKLSRSHDKAYSDLIQLGRREGKDEESIIQEVIDNGGLNFLKRNKWFNRRYEEDVKDKDGNIIHSKGDLREDNWDINKFLDKSKAVYQFYKGGEVEKSGIAAVSEGELIIPAEYNPFYRGGKSRLTRKNEEDKAKTNFFKTFKNSFKKASDIPGRVDGQLGNEDDDEVTWNDRTKQIGSDISSILDNAGWIDETEDEKFIHRDFDDEKWNATDEFYAAHYKKGKEPLLAKMGKQGKVLATTIKATGMKWFKKMSIASSRLNSAYEKIADQMEDAAGDDQDQEKLWNEMTADIKENYKKYIPSALGGGVIGSGVSLLTGAFGGPLLGFAIGAGVDLVTKSDKVKDWLFGEIDEETGERKGNIISKHIVNNINKYLPGMAKGAVVGGITSILPFVPGGAVSGIILGSAIGFAKNNDRIMSALFGDLDEDGNRTEGGLFNADFRNKLREALPRMALGGAIGVFTGPFGPIGNILLGSSIGFATKLQSVQDTIFGKVNEETGEREGGIVGTIEDKVITPIGRAFDPLVKQGELLFKNFAQHVTDKVDGILEEKLGVPFSRWFKEKVFDRTVNATKKVGGALLNPTVNLLTSPFGMVEKLGDRFRRRHIAEGNADYMTAQQRNEYRQELKDRKIYEKYEDNVYDEKGNLVHRKGDLKKDENGDYIDTGKKRSYIYKRIKKDKFKRFDNMLASRNTSYDSLVEMRDGLKALQDPDKGAKKMKKDAIHDINKIIGKNTNIDIDDAQEISELLEEGNIEKATRKIRRLGLSTGEEGRLMKSLTSGFAKLTTAKQLNTDREGVKNSLYKKLSKMGLTDISDKTIGRYTHLLDKEIKNKEEMGLDKFNNEQERRYEGIVSGINNAIDAIRAIYDTKYREKLLTKNFKDTMKQTVKRRGIFADYGDNGLYGGKDFDYEVKLNKKGEEKYYRYKLDKDGNRIEDTKQRIGKDGRPIDKDGHPIHETDEDMARANRDYFQGTAREGLIRRTVKNKIVDPITAAKNHIVAKNNETTYERYQNDVKDEDDNIIHKKGDLVLDENGGLNVIGFAGDYTNNKWYDKFIRGTARASQRVGNELFQLNRTDDQIRDLQKRRRNRKMDRAGLLNGRIGGGTYAKAWKNQLKAIENRLKYGDFEDEDERTELQQIFDDLHEKGKFKNGKGDFKKLFSNNANLFQKAFKSRKRLDGTTEGVDENTMYVANSQGKPIKWIKDSEGRWTVDRNDSDNNVYDDAEEENKKFGQKLIDKIAGLGDSVKNGFFRLFKIDEERDTFTKKILKVGVGILGALTIAGFMPILERFWKDKVKPGIGRFWDEKIYPRIKEHLSPIKPAIARAAAGIDTAINKIPSAIDNLTNKVRMFITNDLPNIWSERIIPFYQGGIEWVGEKIGTVIAGASTTILKMMPSIIKGAIKGVWDFLRTDVTNFFMGAAGHSSASDLLSSAASASTLKSSGSVNAFGSTSLGENIENFSGFSSLYERMFHESTDQTLGKGKKVKGSQDERDSKEDYYSGDGSYPSDEELSDDFNEYVGDESGSSSSNKKSKAVKKTTNNVSNNISNISASDMEGYAASSGSSSNTSNSNKNAKVRKAYDDEVKKTKNSAKKAEKVTSQNESKKTTTAKNSANTLYSTSIGPVQTGAHMEFSDKEMGNIYMNKYVPGTTSVGDTVEKTKSSVMDDIKNNGWASLPEAIKDTFTNTKSSIKNIFSNAKYGGLKAYDVTKENAVSEVGGSLYNSTIDQNTGLVYDAQGDLLANVFYDPQYNQFTNRPTEATMQMWPNIYNDYNNELRAAVEANPGQFKYTNGAAYLSEDGMYTDIADSTDTSKDLSAWETIQPHAINPFNNKTMGNTIATAAIRNMLPGTGGVINRIGKIGGGLAESKRFIPRMFGKGLNGDVNVTTGGVQKTNNLFGRVASKFGNITPDFDDKTIKKFRKDLVRTYASNTREAALKDFNIKSYNIVRNAVDDPEAVVNNLKRGNLKDTVIDAYGNKVDNLLNGNNFITEGLSDKSKNKLSQKASNTLVNSIENQADNVVNAIDNNLDKGMKKVTKEVGTVTERRTAKILQSNMDNITAKANKVIQTAKPNSLLKKIKDRIVDFMTYGNVKKKFIKGLAAQVGEKEAEGLWKKVVSEFGDDAVKKIGQILGKTGFAKAGAKIAAAACKWLPIVGWVLTIGTLAWDFSQGFSKAPTIFSLTIDNFNSMVDHYFNGDDMLVRCLTGLANAIANNILLGFIPASTFVGLFMNIIMPFLGQDMSYYENLKEESAAEVVKAASLNNKNDLTLDDYNDKYNGNSDFIQVYKKSENEISRDNTISKFTNNKLEAIISGNENIERNSGKKRNYNFVLSASGSGISQKFHESKETTTDKLISQLDPKYKDIKFKGSEDTKDVTIGSDGCGPAVATMVINKVKQGANLDIEEAAKFAVDKGDKEKDGGATLKYFKDIYAKYNMGTNIIENKTDIKKEIASGSPVVLLGRNTRNNSKVISPFGPNNHYVLADGINGKDIIIRDPEQNKTMSYRLSEILRQTTVGISPTDAIGTGNVRNMDQYMSLSASGTNYNDFLNNTAVSGNGKYRISINRIGGLNRTLNSMSGSGSGIIPSISIPNNNVDIYLNGTMYNGSAGRSYSLRELANMSGGAAKVKLSDESVSSGFQGFMSGKTASSETQNNQQNTDNTNTENKEENIQTNITHSKTFIGEMINVISQFVGSMSFSAIDWSNCKYGIFLWEGQEGAELLYDITNKDKKSSQALFGTYATAWKLIQKKEPLTKKTATKGVQKIITKVVSSSDGKAVQLDRASKQITASANKYTKKLKGKSLMFMVLVDFIDPSAAEEIYKSKKITKSSEPVDIMMQFSTTCPDIYDKYQNEIKFAYYYIIDSPINKFDSKTPTMGDVEQNISSVDIKEDDDNGTWLDDLWSGIQDLGNILFGMGKNDEEGEDGISNSNASKVGEVSDIDVVNSYFEVINDDYKPLKERLEAIKKIYQAVSAQDKDMAAQQTIILFEGSSLFDFLCQFKYFTDSYGGGVTSTEFDNNNDITIYPLGLTKYETISPCVYTEDLKNIGIEKNGDHNSTTISASSRIKNYQDKYKSIKDFSKNISKFEDEAKVLLNRTDYGVEKSYHMQESKSDEALNLYRVFKDQINYFRISGKIGDCKKINNIKLQSGASYSDRIKSFEDSVNSTSGSFNNNFFNKVLICNSDFISNLTKKKSRKGIIKFLIEYMNSGQLTKDMNNELFDSPKEIARKNLYKQWEILGSNKDLTAKAKAWDSAEAIINDAYLNYENDMNISSTIDEFNRLNKKSGLSEVNDFDYTTHFSNLYKKKGILKKNKTNKYDKELSGSKPSDEAIGYARYMDKFRGDINIAENKLEEASMQNKLFNPDSNSNIIRLFNSAKDLDSATKRNISEERLVEDRQSLSAKYQGYNIYNPYLYRKRLQEIISDSKGNTLSFTNKYNSRTIGTGLGGRGIAQHGNFEGLISTSVQGAAKARFLYNVRNMLNHGLEEKKVMGNNGTSGTGSFDVNGSIILPGIQDKLPNKGNTNVDSFDILYKLGGSKNSIDLDFIKADQENPLFPSTKQIADNYYDNSANNYDKKDNRTLYDLMDDDMKKAFDDYYYNYFLTNKNNFVYNSDDPGSDGLKPDAGTSEGDIWNKNNYFEAYNRKSTYETMWGGSHADWVESADNKLRIQEIFAQELLSKADDNKDTKNKRPFMISTKNKKEDNKDKKSAEDLLNSYKNIEEGNIQGILAEYDSYLNSINPKSNLPHYYDYYTPEFLGKKFYENYYLDLTSTEDIQNGEENVEANQNTEQSENAEETSIETLLKTGYRELTKVPNSSIVDPDETMKAKLLNGTATEDEYKKYFAWTVSQGVVPKNKNSKFIKFSEDGWKYPGVKSREEVIKEQQGETESDNKEANSEAEENKKDTNTKENKTEEKTKVDTSYKPQMGGRGAGSGLMNKLLRKSAGSSDIKDNTFVSQLDYKGKFKDGDSLAEYGCGPAVAAMAINNLNSAGNSVANTTAAIAQGYKDSNGTKASYFQDVFSRAGASTEYIDGGDRQSIESNLNSGNQVVLMGQDSNNTSKQNSPFGPSNHYVLATGLDKDRIQINDPEQRSPKVYNKNKVLRNTQLGVAVSGSGFMTKSRFGKFIDQFSGGAGGSQHWNLCSWSEPSAEELAAAVRAYHGKDCAIARHAKDYIDAGKKSKLDPRFLLALNAAEVGWNLDANDCAKANNPYDIAAYNSDPFNKLSTGKYGNPTMRDGIINGACWIKDHYYNAGQTTVYLMCHDPKGSHNYCVPGDNWISMISKIMDKMPENTKIVTETNSLNSETVSKNLNTGSPIDSESSDNSSSKSMGWMQDIIDSVGELGTILNGTNKNNGSSSDGVSFSGNYSTDGTWIGIIKEVKKAIATNIGHYSQGESHNIEIDGKTINIRPDCSGFVSACLEVYGASSGKYTSHSFTSGVNIKGFEKSGWPGWENLIEGDIIATNGHVEIFARNDGGTHYVYNVGSHKSAANPDATKSSRSEYTTVYRCTGSISSASGSGLLLKAINSMASAGRSRYKNNTIIKRSVNTIHNSGAGNNIPAIFTRAKTNRRNIGNSKDRIGRIDTGIVGKLARSNMTATGRARHDEMQQVANIIQSASGSGYKKPTTNSINTRKVISSMSAGKSGRTERISSDSKVYYEDYKKYSAGAAKIAKTSDNNTEILLAKAVELLAKITTNTGNISQIIKILNRITEISKKSNSNNKPIKSGGTTRADRSKMSAGSSDLSLDTGRKTIPKKSQVVGPANDDEDLNKELQLLISNLSEIARG